MKIIIVITLSRDYIIQLQNQDRIHSRAACEDCEMLI